MSKYDGKVNAPDFPPDVEWLNTGRPLSLRDLRGKVVLLDFWTYCCINCMHIIPDLKKLEQKYAKELVVIGVHSAKFPGERETENIRQAVLRYEIEHPV
ncbi:MAG TPA: thioredoxin-like domain-containing protein, partial [Blastocatellia bacterium]|nr:thioredoxin-like domain-containing protein [Blastocatellia bacterium]